MAVRNTAFYAFLLLRSTKSLVAMLLLSSCVINTVPFIMIVIIGVKCYTVPHSQLDEYALHKCIFLLLMH